MGLYLFLAIEAVCVGMVVWGVVAFVTRFRRQRARRASAQQRLDERDIAIEASLTGQTPPGTERRFNTMPPPVEHRAADRPRSQASGRSDSQSADLSGWATLPYQQSFYPSDTAQRDNPSCPDPTPSHTPSHTSSHDSWTSSPSTSDYSSSSTSDSGGGYSDSGGGGGGGGGCD